MRKKSGSKNPEPMDGVMGILRGGKLPKGLLESLKGINRDFAVERAKAEGLTGRMARLSADAQGRRDPVPTDPRSKKAQDELFALHGKFGKRKLAAPKVAAVPGGLSVGRISMTVVPPFDFAITIQTPHTGDGFEQGIESAAASTNGTLSCSAMTTDDQSIASAFAMVGILFHPLSAGRLRVSANPTSSFQWWTNSLGGKEVRSGGGGLLGVHGLVQRPTEPGDFGLAAVAGSLFQQWEETEEGQVRWDARFDQQGSASVELDVVRTQIYLLFISVNCSVLNVGWPGSLAGSMMSVSVPSISWEFQPELVLSPS